MTETKIARYGNSLAVRLPAAIARDLDLHEGDRVALRRVEGGLLLERDPQARLRARLATVRGAEDEVGPDRAVGAENFE
ncbi:MAG: AbrB/MazE/SpoVT family DNA-binding domain-containing protein [Vulcanimicrobiaceae bacterium]